MTRRRADTEPTQRIAPLPPRKDPFWRLSLEQQRAVIAYVDETPAPEQRR